MTVPVRARKKPTEERRVERAREVAIATENQLERLESGVGSTGAAGGKEKRKRKNIGKPIKKSKKVSQDFSEDWKEGSNNHTELAEAIKEFIPTLTEFVPQSTSTHLRLCCFCVGPAAYKCFSCTRGYCSIQCRDKHKRFICFE